MFFEVDQTSLFPPELQFDIKLQSKQFFFKKVYFGIFNQKNPGQKDSFSEKKTR